MDFDKHSFTEFVQCSCRYCGGLVVDGIEFDYETTDVGKRGVAWVTIFMVKQIDYHYQPGFWERVKLVWDLLRGRRLGVDDISYDKHGVEKLRDACEVALAHWPTREELDEPPPSLEEIYAKIQRDKSEQ